MIGKKAGWALLIVVALLAVTFTVYQFVVADPPVEPQPVDIESQPVTFISSNIQPGETLYAVFQKHGLDLTQLYALKQAAADVHGLKDVNPGQPYSFTLDDKNGIHCFTYGINEDVTLKIERHPDGYTARKCEAEYESRILTLGGRIEDSLVEALGPEREELVLAIQVSDILAWDIDFNTDLRRGDTYKIIVEGLYLQGRFKKYGKVLAIAMINDGQKHLAYRFEQNGRPDYFDAQGNSLRKAFLKAPLSFRRISSFFSRSRRHPILKVRRPHQGVDYVAPTGTPVSATADGRVSFIGRRGGYGKLIILSHRNGYSTYYGHLSRYAKGIRAGKQVRQGDLVGHVGATGLASGPHLHYEMRKNSTAVNPLRLRIPAGEPVPASLLASFKQTTAQIDQTLDSAEFYATKDMKSRQMSRNLTLRTDQFPSVN